MTIGYQETVFNIPTYQNTDMKMEEFDQLSHSRFNILNYNPNGYQFQNYYVFRVLDLQSTTGYYGMALKKDFVEKVKQANEIWKKEHHV